MHTVLYCRTAGKLTRRTQNAQKNPWRTQPRLSSWLVRGLRHRSSPRTPLPAQPRGLRALALLSSHPSPRNVDFVPTPPIHFISKRIICRPAFARKPYNSCPLSLVPCIRSGESKEGENEGYGKKREETGDTSHLFSFSDRMVR